MVDDTNTQVVTTPEQPKEEVKVEKESEKTLTQADIDRVVQERLKRNTDKLTTEYESKITKAVEEATKLSKMSADEREKELAKKQTEELANRERDLTLRENKLEGINRLDEMKIPIKFVDFVLSENKDKMEENIKVFSEAWNQAISEAVKSQLKGEPPKDVTPNSKQPVTTGLNPNLF